MYMFQWYSLKSSPPSTNRFKRLDLIECLKDYGQRFVTWYRRQGARPSLRKRNAKWLCEEALQIVEKRREAEGK